MRCSSTTTHVSRDTADEAICSVVVPGAIPGKQEAGAVHMGPICSAASAVQVASVQGRVGRRLSATHRGLGSSHEIAHTAHILTNQLQPLTRATARATKNCCEVGHAARRFTASSTIEEEVGPPLAPNSTWLVHRSLDAKRPVPQYACK